MELKESQTEEEKNYSECLTLRDLREIKIGGKQYINAKVIIAITLHNQSRSLKKTLNSALSQTMVVDKLARIVILDDQSNDDWLSYNTKLIQHDAITILFACCGSPARARNQLLDYARNKSVKWVARLDSDDYLENKLSLESLFNEGEKNSSTFVLGSNRLIKDGNKLTISNIVNSEIFKSKKLLLEFIDDFCSFKSKQELPSCNLLLRANSGFSYPNVKSAEDHWLVAKLLMLHNEKGSFVSTPFYSVYSLDGNDSKQNQESLVWYEQRKRLIIAVSIWYEMLSHNKFLLGVGMEGVVLKEQGKVIKHFYPWAIDDLSVNSLKEILPKFCKNLPKVEWSFNKNRWSYNTPYLNARPMAKRETKKAVISFLTNMYINRVCCLNIKRDNLLVLPDGDFFYIDIGKDIKKFTNSYFWDMSARLYSIAIIGNDDEELVRRKISCNQDASLDGLAGFGIFYNDLINFCKNSSACFNL